MSPSTYSVYLVERGESGGEREITSPVEGYELQFYDTGVWLERENGRNFFPYEQIRTIRELSDGAKRELEAEAESEPDTEREAEASGESDPAERDSGIEGESGPEEEMLEE